ncbi:hypothetical protein DID88_007683 [Monilinia fructigena]|uniref:K Homology domain-containing protein n=1 Tax=Monilinia fructigena TaxID=38457 RepID=A0A395J3K1_9HELO|nr:hypothetical protein DID88_007683 [Monilinia fructigena]
MSASPTTAPTQSTKRPLEDPSSPSAPSDQPDAKRPALDKVVKGDEDDTEKETAVAETSLPVHVVTNGDAKSDEANGTKSEVKDSQGDTVVVDAPTTEGTQPIETTTSAIKAQASSSGNTLTHDESGWIHVRSVITSAEAATVIGKGGENVSLVRKLSGAKCTVSDYQKGAVERILTVSGVVDAVAKAFGLIIRTLNNENLESPSDSSSKTYPLRLLIPHILIGSIIGCPIRSNQLAETMVTLTTIAVVIVVLNTTPGNAYGQPYAQGQVSHQQPAAAAHYGGHASSAVGGYGGVGPQQPQQAGHAVPQPHAAGPQGQPIAGAIPGQPLTQQIFIPNDMVGAIIGKGGAKINEIRQLSGVSLRLMNLKTIQMRDLLRLQEQQSVIKWHYICFIRG